MLTPAALWRRAADRIRERDPENDAARRALRAAIVIPIAAAISFAVGGGSQTPMFTIFGSIALLIVVDFPGNVNARALAYGGLGFNGLVLITIGTLVAPIPWLAVTLMFVIGVAVTLSGVLSEVIAAGMRGTLLTFVLPVCTPPGPLGERLIGWLIALAICVPAALFVFPPRHHGELRRHAAAVCAALANRIEGSASAADVTTAMDGLRANFLGAKYRPVALTAGSRALVRVVDDLQWLCDRVTGDTGDLIGPMADPVVQVLRNSARILRITQSADRAEERALLAGSLAELRTIAVGSYRQDIVDILAEPDDRAAVELGRTLLTRRTIGAAASVTGRIIAAAAAADARPVWARVLGRQLPETGSADRVYPETTAVANLPAGYLKTWSVTARNSLRTGAGLALAVLVTVVFPVQHGFWVVLGAMSVLRSSALTTGTNVVRAVAGTSIGFVIGAIVIELLGVDPVVMWILLPVVAFGSAYVPEIASFTASQAAFTMMVLIVFNLIVPTGWRVGLLRIEDIVVGASVGIVVSLLLWPGGARTAVQRVIETASGVGSRYLRAAVLRVTRGTFEQAENQVNALSHDALTASRTLDDAVRQLLSEGGGPTDSRAPVVRAANRVYRLRAAADMIADIVPPPLGVYPRARTVIEAHAAAICTRLDGSDAAALVAPISDDLVPALRAEAGDSELAVSAALPLVTAAAHIGELELTYPPALAAETRASVT
ncbi:FUSC family protein [Mycolicibacterium sp. CH28]|uniref:FUSC family protein n=1 Tax=Mycolicibacterium sp. CH28 TaxID=2512237 RepID=UPI001081AED5|nr:FUSC family protein [Mycolicibacterium sp. CH28]TGD89941.1 FUSC family protein [Mycolicibacterium sp. CH28]